MHTGAPCVYYGTEVPLEGGYDPDCRRCMDWSAEEKPSEVYKILQRLAALRAKDEIKDGNIKYFSRSDLFLLERTAKNRLRLVVSNGKKPIEYQPEGDVLLSYNYSDYKLNGTGFVIEYVKEED